LLEQAGVAVAVVEYRVAPLVGAGPRGEADREHPGVETPARPRRDRVEQIALERLVARPQLVRRVAGGADARVLPGGRVDPVGDRDDLAGLLHVAPHGARDLGVELGDRVGAPDKTGASD